MIGKPGPFPVIECDGHGDVDIPIAAPRRRYSCENYSTCLNLACALNWDNFTCRGCCGEVNEALTWQAHHARRKDKVANKLCSIPTIGPVADTTVSDGQNSEMGKVIALAAKS